MKVKDLIKNSIWIPSKLYGDRKPKISIWFPTYSRHKDGYLKKSIDSLLMQSFKDFEIIVIVDGSTDGTQEFIKSVMIKDHRVSCIVHKENIGLPAISCLEAFLKSRGEYIAFGFDDCIYTKDALRILYQAIINKNHDIVCGTAKAGDVITGGSNTGLISNSDLALHNTIPNCSVLVRKTLFNVVGFLDPHLIMSRINDWDLWKRVANITDIITIPSIIAEEHGPFLRDSLGNTRLNDRNSIIEYSALGDRVKGLQMDKILEYSVDHIMPHSSAYLKKYAIDVLHKYKNRSNETMLADGYIHVLAEKYTASVSLCCDGLEPDISGRIVINSVYCPLETLNTASAVVLCKPRLISYELDIIEFCNNRNIPIYLFLDDNLVILAENYSAYQNWKERDVSKVLKKFSGFLFTSKYLIRFFVEKGLVEKHKTRYLSPVIQDFSYVARSKKRNDKSTLNIAYIGGGWRNNVFIDVVLPAIVLLSKQVKVRLFIPTEVKIGDVRTDNLRVTEIKQEIYYKRFIGNLIRENIDIVVHPSPNDDTHLLYKTFNVLLNAYHLEAVAFLSNLKPYTLLKKFGCAMLCKNDIGAWHGAMVKYIENPEVAREKLKANARYSEKYFSAANNSAMLRDILNDAAQKKQQPLESKASVGRIRVIPFTILRLLLLSYHYIKRHKLQGRIKPFIPLFLREFLIRAIHLGSIK